jgi:hypothetical protein
MTLKGKGFMIWQIPRCEGGDAQKIANAAADAGLTHILIKIANGTLSYNVDKETNTDLVPPVIAALRAKGISVWGWHYVYGYNPVGEAQIAIKRIKELGLDGYSIDAEAEYKEPGKATAAKTYMAELRKSLPNLPIALCSYRYPSYHPQLPWKEFLEKCDINMPQVYWQSAHNPGDQLRRCVSEFQAMTPFRPIMPTGPVYRNYGWEPTVADIQEYLDTCVALNLSSTNFFTWTYARSILLPLWEAIAAYPWPSDTPPQEVPEQFIRALNTHDAAQVSNLYLPTAVHITAAQTIQGPDAIKAWYSTFLNQNLPNGIFKLTGTSGTGNSRHFTWEATSSNGKVLNGNDTIGIQNNKIAYHYSFFTITP